MVSLWQRDQSDEDLGEHFALVVSELRAALHLTRRAAEAELETASTWLNELLLSGIRCAAGKSTFDGPRSSATPPSICPMTYGASSSSTRSVTPAISPEVNSALCCENSASRSIPKMLSVATKSWFPIEG